MFERPEPPPLPVQRPDLPTDEQPSANDTDADADDADEIELAQLLRQLGAVEGLIPPQCIDGMAGGCGDGGVDLLEELLRGLAWIYLAIVGNQVDEGAGATAGMPQEPMVTVQHFTDPVTNQAIVEGGNILRGGTYVTYPSEVAGMNQLQVERALAIAPGKGAVSTTFQVPQSALGPAQTEKGPLEVQFSSYLLNPQELACGCLLPGKEGSDRGLRPRKIPRRNRSTNCFS